MSDLAPATEPDSPPVLSVAERRALLVQALRLHRDCYPHLSDDQFEQLRVLLLTYNDVFSLHELEFGCIPGHLNVFYRVDTGDAKPITQSPYKLSQHERMALKLELQRLLRLGVIKPCNSAWISPVVMVRKPNGKWRLTCDMRKLNQASQPDPYPLPTVEDMYAHMSGCQLWSQLDAVTGFWQVPVHEDDMHKLGFTTPFGNFTWTRMPMGVTGAPAAFQRLMDTMLDGVERAKTYVDDTFASTVDFDTHLHTLREVLERVRAYGMKLNPEKCSFCVTEVVCLGHVVSKDGVRPVDSKVSAILELPLPQNIKSLRGFLGMVGYYRKFIKDFAKLAGPLELLKRRNVSFVWSVEAISAFEQLKKALCEAPCLALPRWDQEFILTTDWSCGAIGAVLSQVHPATGEEHPVCFASRSLTDAERRYAASEGECLAVKWAIDKFHFYVHGRRFKLRTDHQALQWLDSARYRNSKLERWALQLQEYDFTVEYIKGETNVVADHLSRACSAVAMGYCRPHVWLTAADLQGNTGGPSVWPQHAERQRDLDAVACDICGDAGGFDNMAICSGCDRCFHLRCVMPPMSSVPSGDWLCPGCDPLFGNFAELFDSNTVLKYHSGDAYLHDALLAYVRSGMDPAVLVALSPKEAHSVQQRAAALKPHPLLSDWLLVFKSVQGCSRWLVYPPLHYRWDLIRVMHDSLGHAGVNQTASYMQQFFHWPGLREDVSRYVKSCDNCQRRKLVLPAMPQLQQPVIRGPFEHVHIDLCGPFETPEIGISGRITQVNKPVKAYVVCMIDYFTKAAEFAIIYEKTAAAVAKAFYYTWVCRYFVPSHVTSDNGTEFDKQFAHMLARLGIKHVHTSACHPAANGVCERLVKGFKAMLTAHINAHPQHWVQSVPVIRMQYWSRLHSALGMSPQEMVYGRRPVPVIPLSRQLLNLAAATVPVVCVCPSECHSPFEHVRELQETFAGYDAEVYERIRRQFLKNAKGWPGRSSNLKNRLADQQLHVGDLVLEVLQDPVSTLGEHVKGPFRIVDFAGMDNEVAILSTGETQFKEAALFRRHVSTLAKYFTKYSA